MTKRIAVLIDGENLSADLSEAILRRAKALGDPFLRRVYGNVALMPGWSKQAEFTLVHSGSGKNSADVLLAIDAMELAGGRLVEGFVLASSDGDFTHIATRLREKGLNVLGMGAAKTPPAFRHACSAFYVMESKAAPPPPKPAAKPAPTPTSTTPATKGPEELDLHIRAQIAANSKQGRGMKIVDLSLAMRTKHNVTISALPEKRWRTYLAARPALYDLDPKGPDAFVRFHPAGFCASTKNGVVQ